MTNDTEALVERLRNMSADMTGNFDGEHDAWANGVDKATDRITELTALAEELAGALGRIKDRTRHDDLDTPEDDTRDKRIAHSFATSALTKWQEYSRENSHV